MGTMISFQSEQKKNEGERGKYLSIVGYEVGKV